MIKIRPEFDTSQPLVKTTNERITQLDGWRGISILLVIVGHVLNYRYTLPGSPERPFPAAYMLSTWGVNIFFVISGFIITKLALSEREAVGSFSARAFYVRRFFRIIPPFFLYLAFILLATQAEWIFQDPSKILRAMSFTCNFPRANCGWFAAHTWSLAYEEQFYLVFPLLFLLSTRNIRCALIAILLLSMSYPFLRYLLQLEGFAHTISEFLPSFVFICAGSVMGAHEPILKRLANRQSAVYFTYLAAGCVVAILLIANSPADLPLGNVQLQKSLGITVLPVCMAWLIGSSLYRRDWLTRVLQTRALQFVGLISYSLYLWQQLFVGRPSFYAADSWLLFTPAMFLVATVSYYLIERPGVRLGKRLLAWKSGPGTGIHAGNSSSAGN